MNKESFCKEMGVSVEDLDVLYRTVKKSKKVPTKGISGETYKYINEKYPFKDVFDFIALYKTFSTSSKEVVQEDKSSDESPFKTTSTVAESPVNFWGSSDYTKKTSRVIPPWEKYPIGDDQPPVFGEPTKKVVKDIHELPSSEITPTDKQIEELNALVKQQGETIQLLKGNFNTLLEYLTKTKIMGPFYYERIQSLIIK